MKANNLRSHNNWWCGCRANRLRLATMLVVITVHYM